jgi:hypothetical protein
MVPLLALILAASCSSDSQVIARVGNREIRAEDMVATARVLAARGALPPDSTKVRLLNALIQRELLVIAAQQLGFHRDTAFPMRAPDRARRAARTHRRRPGGGAMK